MAIADQFNATIDKFVERSKAEMLNVVKEAIQDTVVDAQTPVAKGGRMRVDTGFLRNSGTAALNSIPSGETKGVKGQTYNYTGDQLNRILAQMKFGDTFYYGWTAIYARRRELYDGFLTASVLNWSNNVRQAAKRASARSAFKGDK